MFFQNEAMSGSEQLEHRACQEVERSMTIGRNMDQVTKHFMQQVLEKAILIITTIFSVCFLPDYSINPFTFITSFKFHNSPMK